MPAGNRTVKPTYPALFKEGFAYVADGDIERIFVGIIESPKRKMLASTLRLLVQKLRSLGLKGELWINGSFSTKNPDPMDIDLLLVIPRVIISALPEDSKMELNTITGDRALTRRRWNCDIYTIESSDIGRRKYFEELFSRNPDRNNRKGIPVIRL